MKQGTLFGLVGIVALTAAVAGCDTSTSDSIPAGTSAGHAANKQGDEADQTDMEKMKAGLAKLSAEDAASAEKQHFCPVSGEMLGTMGPPKKVDVNGQQVWICCEGCRDSLLENPDEYLAKLNKE